VNRVVPSSSTFRGCCEACGFEASPWATMSRANFLIPSRLAVSAGPRLPLISASAEPCWRESAHHRFAWEDDESTTGLTSTAGWMTISHEGGP
jgi:hypothetical protein